MELQLGSNKVSFTKLALLPALLIISGLLMLVLSCTMYYLTPYKGYAFWFLLAACVFNVTIIIINTIKLCKILKLPFPFLNTTNHIDSSFISSNVPVNYNLNSREQQQSEQSPTIVDNHPSRDNYDTYFTNSQLLCYEDIPLPLVVTNKDGIVISFNKLAQNFFKVDLTALDISECINCLKVHQIRGCSVINANIKVGHGEEFLTSIFQTSIYDDMQNLQAVVILFLPSYINTNYKNHSTNTEKENPQNNTVPNRVLWPVTNNIIDVANLLKVGIVVLDKSNNIVVINHKTLQLLNCSPDRIGGASPTNKSASITYQATKNSFSEPTELIGRPFQQVFQSILPDFFMNNLLKLAKGSDTLKLQDSITLAIDHVFSQEYKIITFADITERQALEQQHSFSQRLQTIGQIASAVAHDFNNLLTAIMSFTYFLKERYTEEDPSWLELHQIEQNANRAKVMIRQLLTFSRRKELNPINMNINSEISNFMSTILRLMGESIETKFIRGKNIGSIVIDPVEFHQILINLVVNAKYAMKNNGTLTIRTNLVKLSHPLHGVLSPIPPGNYVDVSIEDQGEGIKPENFKKIFQRDFSTKGDKGNGLGLATVAKIMEENSGFIGLESELNKGTIFHLYFPVEPTRDSFPDTNDNLTQLHSKSNQDIVLDLTGTATILLVEDEVPVRTVCKRALINKGYQVIEAENAENALSLLQNSLKEVDLIISDVKMPGISGLELISEAKKIKPSLKAILMSGYAEDTLEDNHYSLESIEFLAKPFSPDILATKVKKVISN